MKMNLLLKLMIKKLTLLIKKNFNLSILYNNNKTFKKLHSNLVFWIIKKFRKKFWIFNNKMKKKNRKLIKKNNYKCKLTN